MKENRLTKPRLTYLEQKEFETIEETILEAEARLEEATTTLSDADISSDAEKLAAAYTAREAAQEEVDRLYARWAELDGKSGN